MATPQEFISALKRYVGVPYVWGGKTAKGLDCSGLIHLALADVGVKFVHGSANQIAATTPISVEQAWRTPGALLYREGHDAISLGDGTCIEAIRPKVAITKRTATYQGKPRFTRAGVIPGIHKVSGVDVSKMVSPAQGRFTSGYGKRKLSLAPFHAGVDIAPPVPGTIGEPVVAAFAGVVEKAGWGIVAYRSGNGVLIRNPDGERQYYGHLNKIRVKVGQSVKAGDRIGDMGATGKVTGAHLHFETWRNSSQSSHYDPMVLFDKYGVTIGSAPVTIGSAPVTTGGGSAPKPTPAPKEYFDMDKKTFESGLDAAFKRNADYMINKLFAARINIAGNLAKALGVKTMNVSTILRHSAANLTEMRQRFNNTNSRLNAQNKVLKQIASKVGLNQAELKEINDLLDERLPEPIEIKMADLEDEN